MAEFDPNEIKAVSGLYEEHYCSIPKYLIFTILTIGIFNLYWNHRQMQACNDLLDENRFGFFRWIGFSIITFGLYHIYYQYKMGRAITEIQKVHKEGEFAILPMISVLGTILGFSIVVDCIHQHELNKIVQ